MYLYYREYGYKYVGPQVGCYNYQFCRDSTGCVTASTEANKLGGYIPINSPMLWGGGGEEEAR